MKCDFGDADETMIYDVEMPFKRILYVPGF
jgi:hypothetical protein